MMPVRAVAKGSFEKIARVENRLRFRDVVAEAAGNILQRSVTLNLKFGGTMIFRIRPKNIAAS